MENKITVTSESGKRDGSPNNKKYSKKESGSNELVLFAWMWKHFGLKECFTSQSAKSVLPLAQSATKTHFHILPHAKTKENSGLYQG